MPKLQGLSNNRLHRRVREVVENGEETIFIYEPSVDDVEAIIELQDILSETTDGSSMEVIISGNDVVRRVFPMLTNIDGIEDLSDEEIEEIVANPSIALLQVQHVIETIITQIYKTVILSAKKQILEADFDAASLSALDGVLSQVAGLNAKTSEKGAAILNTLGVDNSKVVSITDRGDEAPKALENKREKPNLELVEESEVAPVQESAIDEYTEKLDRYLESFASKDED